jgi:predicted MFS family arabinose efflux permease
LLLGVAIGGFWAMSTATAMRLVPADKVPKALAVIFSSVSIATVVAAPLGSYLGSLIGWRNVFILCIVPSIAGAAVAALGTAVHEAGKQRQPENAVPRAASSGNDRRSCWRRCLSSAATFAFFTYLRPFLETVGQASVESYLADPAGLWARQLHRHLHRRASAGA